MKYLIYCFTYCLFAPLFAFAQLNTTFLSQTDYTPNLNDIWGYADGQHEYALVGLTSGVSIVDVTDPVNPVELHYIASAASTWRDLKTWGNYAYVVNEKDSGLLIIDMANVQTEINYHYWKGAIFQQDSVNWTTAHNIFIDENGIAYIVGVNNSQARTIMIDVDANPENPPIVGLYNDGYVHDVFVRNDTMWAAEIYNGFFTVVDVSDKANPVVMASQETPNEFAHNVWLNDQGTILYTTDEKKDAYVAAYDVSDITDIKELDRYQSSPGFKVIPHNTFWKDNFLYTSYYKDGVTIVDATYSYNLVEVGNYDTSPLPSSSGFAGCWGVYPYLPSGNILASDMQQGLFVLGANVLQAAYFEGTVTDTVGDAIPEVSITLFESSSDNTYTAENTLDGTFATGTPSGGDYTALAFLYGYDPVYQAVNLVNGEITYQDFELEPATPFEVQIEVVDAETGALLPNVKFHLNPTFEEINATTDDTGLLPLTLLYADDYKITLGKWGYKTQQLTANFSMTNTTLTIALEKGYYDDFFFDFTWTVSGSSTAGTWTRSDPVGTVYLSRESNPGYDAVGDFGTKAYVTGNGGGLFDVTMQGDMILKSPVMDLTSFEDPVLTYNRWAFLQPNCNDSMRLRLTNGADTVTLEFITTADTLQSQWLKRGFVISEHIAVSDSMRFFVESYEFSPTHFNEMGFDFFEVRERPVLSANFEVNDTLTCAGDVVLFNNLTLDADSVYWYFEGTNLPPIQVSNPSISYPTGGTYDVTLVAYNFFDADSMTISDYIHVSSGFPENIQTSPAPNPNSGMIDLCVGESDVVNSIGVNSPEDILSFWWDGENNQSNAATIDITETGMQQYELTMEAANSCDTTFVVTVNGNTAPLSTFSLADTICLGSVWDISPDTTAGTAPFAFQWNSNNDLLVLNENEGSVSIDASDAALLTTPLSLTLTVTDAANCANTYTDNFVVEVCANVEAFPIADTTSPLFSLYPNPNRGQFVLRAENPLEEIQIFNPFGQLVWQEQYGKDGNVQTSNIDLSALPKSWYYLQVKTQGNYSWQKIMVQ